MVNLSILRVWQTTAVHNCIKWAQKWVIDNYSDTNTTFSNILANNKWVQIAHTGPVYLTVTSGRHSTPYPVLHTHSGSLANKVKSQVTWVGRHRCEVVWGDRNSSICRISQIFTGDSCRSQPNINNHQICSHVSDCVIDTYFIYSVHFIRTNVEPSKTFRGGALLVKSMRLAVKWLKNLIALCADTPWKHDHASTYMESMVVLIEHTHENPECHFMVLISSYQDSCMYYHGCTWAMTISLQKMHDAMSYLALCCVN